jgi:hypothetical protein
MLQNPIIQFHLSSTLSLNDLLHQFLSSFFIFGQRFSDILPYISNDFFLNSCGLLCCCSSWRDKATKKLNQKNFKNTLNPVPIDQRHNLRLLMINLLLGGQLSGCIWGSRVAAGCEFWLGWICAEMTIDKLAVTIDAAQSFPDYARFTKKSLVSHQLQQLLLAL